ncbi:P-selectin [Bagarius yarrelli]|uniref:E-selectin n=1 Tax=Bagarius yarrelli TaxID=175774 RepID=A0A556V6F0_BAGYA|nr:P-selectin [Bagarius yarrelli]
MTWTKARDWCTEHYTDMVAIQNHGEIKYLNNTLPRLAGYYWIGIRKINNIWTWIGTKKNLTAEAENWATGEPNNGRNNEDCVEIYIKREHDSGKWNDESCKKKKTALCYTVVKCEANEISDPEHGSVQCHHPIGNFSYKSDCQYSCDEGYQLFGAKTTQCGGTRAWSNKPPTCKPARCLTLKEPIDGKMSCTGDSYGSRCMFSCNAGFRLLGVSEVTCTAAAQWNQETPSCQASCEEDSCSYNGECVETINSHRCDCFEGFYGIRCEHVVKCEANEISDPEHGSVQCHHPIGNFSYKSDCQYSCDEGYQLFGAKTTQCGGTRAWSNKPPTCKPARCLTLKEPIDGKMSCTGDSYGSRCMFSCNAGFRLLGVSEVTCTAAAQWNQETPSCQAVECPDLQAPQDGSVFCTDQTLRKGSICSFTCSEGFILKGALNTECTETGEWRTTPPTCTAVRCPELQEPNNGFINCSSQEALISTACFFSCLDGYELHEHKMLLCGPNGNWTGEVPVCRAYPVFFSFSSVSALAVGVGGTTAFSGLALVFWILSRLRKLKVLVMSWSYTYSNQTMTWTEAKAWCENQSKHLMVIQNEQHNNYLKNNLPQLKTYYWIGLRKTAGVWTWQGTELMLESGGSWADNEPNNKKQDEDCVEIYIKNGTDNGKWNDEKCSKQKHALCYNGKDACVCVCVCVCLSLSS